MEKAISPEERIRRAEEIYYRRKNNLNISRTATVNLNPKKQYKLLKKTIVQILVCVGIYFLIYSIQANSDNLSIDSINYIKNMLSYDMDLQKYINEGKKYLDSFYSKKEETQESNSQSKSVENTAAVGEEITQVEDPTNTNNQIEDTSNMSQMEQDAKYIKENFSLIKPAEGEISSKFGPRNPTTETVPKYHTGIDIAVPEGTIFISSMDGIYITSKND